MQDIRVAKMYYLPFFTRQWSLFHMCRYKFTVAKQIKHTIPNCTESNRQYQTAQNQTDNTKLHRIKQTTPNCTESNRQYQTAQNQTDNTKLHRIKQTTPNCTESNRQYQTAQNQKDNTKLHRIKQTIPNCTESNRQHQTAQNQTHMVCSKQSRILCVFHIRALKNILYLQVDKKYTFLNMLNHILLFFTNMFRPLLLLSSWCIITRTQSIYK